MDATLDAALVLVLTLPAAGLHALLWLWLLLPVYPLVLYCCGARTHSGSPAGMAGGAPPTPTATGKGALSLPPARVVESAYAVPPPLTAGGAALLHWGGTGGGAWEGAGGCVQAWGGSRCTGTGTGGAATNSGGGATGCAE